MYSNEEKQQILQYATDNGVMAACREFKVRPDTIKYWTSDKHKLKVKKRVKSHKSYIVHKPRFIARELDGSFSMKEVLREFEFY